MDEITIMSWIFGSLLTIGAAVLFFLAYKIGWKYMVQEKRCRAKTVGIVKKYGASSAGVSAAIVFFEVDGKTYKARAWTPTWQVTKTTVTPGSKPTQTYEEDGDSGNFTFTQNSFLRIEKDPMRQKHPLGEKLEVWYDPQNPKLCYAEKYANKKIFFWMFLIGGLVCLAIDILTLVMLHG